MRGKFERQVERGKFERPNRERELTLWLTGKTQDSMCTPRVQLEEKRIRWREKTDGRCDTSVPCGDMV